MKSAGLEVVELLLELLGHPGPLQLAAQLDEPPAAPARATAPDRAGGRGAAPARPRPACREGSSAALRQSSAESRGEGGTPAVLCRKAGDGGELLATRREGALLGVEAVKLAAGREVAHQAIGDAVVADEGQPGAHRAPVRGPPGARGSASASRGSG